MEKNKIAKKRTKEAAMMKDKEHKHEMPGGMMMEDSEMKKMKKGKYL